MKPMRLMGLCLEGPLLCLPQSVHHCWMIGPAQRVHHSCSWVGGGRIASGLQMSEKDPSKWTLAAGSHPMIPKVSNFATRAEWQAGRRVGCVSRERRARKRPAAGLGSARRGRRVAWRVAWRPPARSAARYKRCSGGARACSSSSSARSEAKGRARLRPVPMKA